MFAFSFKVLNAAHISENSDFLGVTLGLNDSKRNLLSMFLSPFTPCFSSVDFYFLSVANLPFPPSLLMCHF